jgi:hypothetical protein
MPVQILEFSALLFTFGQDQCCGSERVLTGFESRSDFSNRLVIDPGPSLYKVLTFSNKHFLSKSGILTRVVDQAFYLNPDPVMDLDKQSH